jgi:hypothetical protein
VSEQCEANVDELLTDKWYVCNIQKKLHLSYADFIIS